MHESPDTLAQPTPPSPTIGRRGAVVGLGAVGAAATAAALLPLGRPDADPSSTPGADADPPGAPRPGYRLTEHIQRYYGTARL